jgi:hypothetical protein
MPLHHQNKTKYQLTKLSGKCERVQRERQSSNQPQQATHLYLKNIYNEIIVGMLPSNVFIPITIFLA